MDANVKNQTVGQLVAELPRRSKVFEKYGIDYCCGGKRPLGEAISERGVSESELLSDLRACESSAAVEEVDWRNAPMTALADHIESTHHAFMREALPRIAALTEKVARVYAEKRPEMQEVHQVFNGLRAEIEMHLLKEEKVLFPLIRELDSSDALPRFHCGTVLNPISVMEHEHEAAGAALAKMRTLTHGYQAPEDVCNTFRALLDALAELEDDLHLHIHKENNILFPRAAEREAQIAGQMSALDEDSRA